MAAIAKHSSHLQPKSSPELRLTGNEQKKVEAMRDRHDFFSGLAPHYLARGYGEQRFEFDLKLGEGKFEGKMTASVSKMTGKATMTRKG